MPRKAGGRGLLSEAVLVKLSREQYDRLKAAALVYGVSEPELLRTALDELLEGNRSGIQAVLRSIQKARQIVQARK